LQRGTVAFRYRWRLPGPIPYQTEVNSQDLLEGFTSSPERGIISNTTFLLHISQEVWDAQVFPALQVKFAA